VENSLTVPRYAVISWSTDLRCPDSKVRILRSKRAALAIKASGNSGGYTYENPDLAHNWHRTFINVYELPVGVRLPSVKALRKEAKKASSPTYPRSWEDMLADYIRRVGVVVKEDN